MKKSLVERVTAKKIKYRSSESVYNFADSVLQIAQDGDKRIEDLQFAARRVINCQNTPQLGIAINMLREVLDS